MHHIPYSQYQKGGEMRKDAVLDDQQSNPNVRPLLADEGISERPLQLRKMINRPKFTASNLETWKREIRFWRELYATVPETQVLANMGLSGE